MVRPEFDAEARGARCSECPLNATARPITPVTPSNPRLIILGEAPGRTEEEEGTPWLANGARQLRIACETFKVPKASLHLTHAVLCKPPHKKFKPKEWAKARECCAPRLERELACIPKATPILACGEQALQAVTNKTKLKDWVGAPLQSHLGRPVMPNFHPAWSKPSWLPAFRIFFGRALQLAQGTMPLWQWGEIVTAPDHGMVMALQRIKDSGEPVAIDVESVPHLVLIGLAIPGLGVSVPYPIDDPQIATLVREIIEGPQEKVFHNALFDIIELRRAGYTVTGPVFDTMVAHVVCGAELPHDLGFCVALECAAERWKSEYQLSKQMRKLDRLLGPNFGDFQRYNAKDALATVFLRGRLLARVATVHNGPALFAELTAQADLAMRMREGGLRVETSRFEAHRTALAGIMSRAAAKFREFVPDEKYTLGAAGTHPSLRTLFFEAFGVRPLSYTDEGEPQLNKQALKEIKLYGGQVAEVADAALNFREAAKLRTTYLDSLELDEHSILRPTWKPWGAVSRWSSAEPNAQNWPPKMRDIVVAKEPGHFIVGADFSALELRIVALLAGDEKLLQWYAEGRDVHTMTARALFGVETPSKMQRDIAKTVAFGVNYNASEDVTTIWKAAQAKLPRTLAEFLTIGRLKKYRGIWFKEHPWIRQWQLDTLKFAEKHKFVQDELSGARRHFHDGHVDPNVALNFPVQRFANSVCGRAILKLDKMLTPDERITAQIHDAIYGEGPDPDALCAKMVDAMTQTVTLGKHTVTFVVEVGTGYDWSCSLKFPGDNSCTFADFYQSLASWFLPEREAALRAAVA